MKIFSYLLLIFFAQEIFGAQLQQLPHPTLGSAHIEWWKPNNFLAPKLHMTLRIFEIGDIWKGFSIKNIYEKRRIKKEYYRLKSHLIEAQRQLVSSKEFNHLFKNEIDRNDLYVLKAIDIISTHPKFHDHYILNTSGANPSGTDEKIAQFRKYLKHHVIDDNSHHHWYLIAKLEPNILNFRNKLCFNHLFEPFPQTNKYGYLPHITLGRIERITEFDHFLSAIRLTNIRLSRETLERKSFKLNDIERLHPNNHKTYLLLDKAAKGNMIFMLVIGWKTPLGKVLKNVVATFPDQTQTNSQKMLKVMSHPTDFVKNYEL